MSKSNDIGRSTAVIVWLVFFGAVLAGMAIGFAIAWWAFA